MRRGGHAPQPALFDELAPVNDEPQAARTRRLNRDRARRYRRRRGAYYGAHEAIYDTPNARAVDDRQDAT